MKNKLIFIFVVLLDLNVLSQFNCSDIFYNEDSLVVMNDELYSGYCSFLDKLGKVKSKSYYGYGVLDSVLYFDKNGLIEAVEPYSKEMINGILKSYYKSGALKQSINYKNDKHFGLWREYYEDGKIKYEAEYVDDYTTKNNSYYTWTKKGVKCLHNCVENDKTKHVGKLVINSGDTKCKRTKVKNTN